MFITLFACLLLAMSVHAHVPGYEVIAVSGTVPTLDGIINPGEWADASMVNFDGITVYVKHYDWGGFVQVFVGFHIPDPTFSIFDEAMVSLDGWHDDGSPPNAPKSDDDLRCIISRIGLFTEEKGSIPPGAWTPSLDMHCLGAAQDSAQGYWEAEFEITYDNQMLLPFETNGLMLKTIDIDIGLEQTWPSFPNGDEVDLSTWGHLLWPGAAGSLTGGIGPNDPGDHDWYYDPEADPNNEMVQFKLTANGEDIIFNDITLIASGTGNDAIDISLVILATDANGNGNFDPGSDMVLERDIYPADNGQLRFNSFAHTISEGTTSYFLIIYQMSSASPVGATYHVDLTNIRGIGVSSGQIITLMMSLIGNTKTITASPTSVGSGSSNPGDHNWYYDPQGDPYNEMLQFDFTATNRADVQINSITLKSSGTGDDQNDIATIYLVLDSNNNGIYDTGDTLLLSGSYASDNGQLWLSFGTNPLVVSAGTTAHLLIAYEMTSSSSVGDTFKVQVISINAINVDTGAQETVNGLPITSGTKTTVAGPTPEVCSGILSLTLVPDTAEASGIISAALTGLVDCSGKTASVKWYSCQGAVVCTASVGETAGYCAFAAPAYEGRYLLYGCIDMNGDGDYGDFGEQAYDVLTVESEEESCTITNCGGCTDESTCTSIGCNWCDNVCQPGACEGENISDGNITNGGDGEEPAPFDITPYLMIGGAIIIGAALVAFAFYFTRRPPAPRRK